MNGGFGKNFDGSGGNFWKRTDAATGAETIVEEASAQDSQKKDKAGQQNQRRRPDIKSGRSWKWIPVIVLVLIVLLVIALLITGGVPLTVGMLQDAFLGREFKADLGSRFSCDFSHDAAGQVSSLNVHYNGRSQATYQVNYADVQYTLGGPVAHEVSIATQIKGKDLMLDLSYNNIGWNSQLKVDTTIPKGYTRIDGKQLFSIFEQ